MIRSLIVLLLLLVPIAMGGQWLLLHPGTINIHWLEYDIQLHTALAVAGLVAFCITMIVLVLAVWQLATWPQRRRARHRYRTLARGLTHLTQGMTALAIGNEAEAEAALKKARATLPDQPLPQLLTAQLLQRQGKQEAARTQLRALLKHEATALLATHHLIEQHILAKEYGEAITLAEQSREKNKSDRWLALTLIDLHARMGNARAMLALTEGWQWQSPLTKEERHHFAALAYYLLSQDADNDRAVLHALRHATGYAPNFLPATIAYAEQLLGTGNARAARKLLLKVWKAAPLPLLFTPILDCLRSTTERQQQRLLKQFIRGTLTHHHHLLAAQHALETGALDAAKTSLDAALAIEETRLADQLMAELEKRLHGAEKASTWLSRAVHAPAEESFICQRCGSSHVAWQSHCHGCGGFDLLRYERPEARITSVELAVTT